MTSNIGSQYFKELSQIGFGGLKEDEFENKEEQFKEKVQEALRQTFKPEFLNRIDDVIIFHALKPADIEKIVEIQLSLLKKKLIERNIKVSIEAAAKKYLVDKGFDPGFGARPLKRLIQKIILDQLADKIIKKQIKDGDKIKINFTKSAITVDI